MSKQAKKTKGGKLKATTTVYSYYFPEVRRVIDRVVKRYPHDVFLRSVAPGLDDYHLPVIVKYIRAFRGQLQGIERFRHRYVTAGASEPIFHMLAKIRTAEPKTPLYVLRGEYQGYKEYARTLRTKVREVTMEEIAGNRLPAGICFLSNPSAINGMILPGAFIKALCRRHRVVLDATYVGLTRPFVMNVVHPNIIAIIVSLSKPFGLYYYRIGFVFSRSQISSLEANKWFKNIFSLIIADRLLSTIQPGALWKKYAPVQRKIVMRLRKAFGVQFEPADVFILAMLDEASVRDAPSSIRKLIQPYRRDTQYRFCITPYFLEYESR